MHGNTHFSGKHKTFQCDDPIIQCDDPIIQCDDPKFYIYLYKKKQINRVFLLLLFADLPIIYYINTKFLTKSS